jgi:hypothetical protein
MAQKIVELEEFDEETGKMVKRKYKVLEERKVEGGGKVTIMQPA